MEQSKYSIVFYEAKKILGITLTEYCLLDIVKLLQMKTGYCYASKKYLAESLDISEKSVFNLIKKLIELGLLIKSSDNSQFLKVSDKFIEITTQISYEKSSYSMQNLHSDYAKTTDESMQKLPNDYVKTSYNNNNILTKDKNSNKKNIDLTIFQNDLLRKKVAEFIEYRKEIKKPYLSQKSIESLKTQLLKLSNNNINLAIDIINQTIANGWQGLFEIKTNIVPKQNNYSTSSLETLK